MAAPAASRLPLGKAPPGKVFLLILPHHDDHTWEYGFGGLIGKLVDAGYTGYAIRITNDEKDGSHGWSQNDIGNLHDAIVAIRHLGMKDVISLNWRNDHSDSVPLNEIRAQLVLLIRKYRPEIVMSYNPWGHYDRNPDHRKSARAIAEAAWAAGNPHFYPEHLKLGLRPYSVPYRYYSQRSDYGLGYTPNIAIELNESQMARTPKAFWAHQSYGREAWLAEARAVRDELARNKLAVPELEGLSDEQVAQKLIEWRLYAVAARKGKENGVRYAEVFYFVDEFDDLPDLKDYILRNAVKK